MKKVSKKSSTKTRAKTAVPRTFFLNQDQEMEALFGEVYRAPLSCQNWNGLEILAWRKGEGSPIRRGAGVGICARSAGYKQIIHLSPAQTKKIILALQQALESLTVDAVMTA